MIAILIVALVAGSISFLCSLMEAALYAVPVARVQSLVDQKVAGASRLLALRQRVDRPISAILTFNTMANTVGASIFGAMAVAEYGIDSPIAIYVLPVGFALMILIFSEIIPKTLGVIFADQVAPKTAVIIEFLIVALYPLVRMSEYVTARIRTAGQDKKTVTEEDLIAQARLGVEEGTIHRDEATYLENALRLNEKTAHDIMTPRTVVYTLPAELPISMARVLSDHWVHSRLPLCEDNNPDKVVGIVYRRDLFQALLSLGAEQLETTPLSTLKQPVDFVPESMTADEILRRFLDGRQHMFIVGNEHGGMEGIITLEDVLEELLGREIVDHTDLHEDMQAYARKLAEMKRMGGRLSSAQEIS
jgi:CBS domain containing-hemolysin-like protein